MQPVSEPGIAMVIFTMTVLASSCTEVTDNLSPQPLLVPENIDIIDLSAKSGFGI